MGFLDKLMFWKKEDDFGGDFDKSVDEHMKQSDDLFKGDDLGLDQKPPGLEEKSPFDQPPAETSPLPTTETPPEQPAAFQAGTEQRDLELLNSKLDTIKALLNSMDQRLANLEKAAGTIKKEEKLW